MMSTPDSSGHNSTIPAIWTRVSATVAPEYSELASQAFLDAGCGGVQIEDTRLEDRGEDAAFLETSEVIVTSYIEREDRSVENRVREALAEYSIPAKIEIEIIDAPDWSTSWRENFPVLHIGKFAIAPTWEEFPEGEEMVIRLDPGLAFGTGQHPTTQMCLELLSERESTLAGKTLLDVGCGSGVLSIAAAKMGAKVWASDYDPHCTEATRENAALNKVEFEVFEAAGLDWFYQEADFVIANLMSDLLISLAPELARVTRSTLVVSGISSPRADDVQAAIENAGFTKLEKREQNGEQRGEVLERWAAFVFARTEEPEA